MNVLNYTDCYKLIILIISGLQVLSGVMLA